MTRSAIFALVVVAIFATTTARAEESRIKSRDFGSEDAELLMQLAQAEMGDADAEDKAMLMTHVLERVWDPQDTISIEQAIMVGGYDSVEDGSFYTAVPDSESRKAIELIYAGFSGRPDKTLVLVTRIVRVLEYAILMLVISFATMLLTLASTGLDKLQRWIGRR